MPAADERRWFSSIEPATTLNTGDVGAESANASDRTCERDSEADGDPRTAPLRQRPGATSTSTETCIDCDACRRIAPEVFAEAPGPLLRPRASRADEAERRRALMALVACPTGSIGTASRADVAAGGLAGFPEPVEENVSFCGFTSARLLRRLELLRRAPGGQRPGRLAAGRPAARFGVRAARRRLDALSDPPRRRRGPRRLPKRASAASASSTRPTSRRGTADVERGHGPRPGAPRTTTSSRSRRRATPAGHAVLLYRNNYLFTGDHLAWSPAADASSPSATPAGTRGRSRSARWSGCSTSLSSGSCRATAAWHRADSGRDAAASSSAAWRG